MLTPVVRRFVLAVWAVVCGIALAMSLWTPAEIVRTEDQNHDGRPDIWRFYDRQGHLRRVEVDTNFDGRADRRDFYRDGILTRSESDRNFDNRIDLIEEFDLKGLQHVRSVVDANFDGTADLLVLFQDGQPVHSEWTAASAVPVPVAVTRTTDTTTATGILAPLDDPFSAATTIRASHRPRAPTPIAVTVPTVMLKEPLARADAPAPDALRVTVAPTRHSHGTTHRLLPARAPPLQALFS